MGLSAFPCSRKNTNFVDGLLFAAIDATEIVECDPEQESFCSEAGVFPLGVRKR
jgi:hypothetical protein